MHVLSLTLFIQTSQHYTEAVNAGSHKIGAVVLIAGIGLIVLSYVLKKQNRQWQQNAQMTDAQVLSFYKERKAYRNNQVEYDYYSDVQYTVQGRLYQSKVKVPNAPKTYVAGARLPIFYNRNNPGDVRLSLSNRMLTTFLLFIGIFFGLIGIVFLL